MKSLFCVLLVLSFTAVKAAGAADAAQTTEDLQREAGMGANSNLMGAEVPKLSASPSVVTGAVMVEDPSWRAAPPPDRAAQTTPGANDRRRTVLMVVLVLTVVAGSQLLRRLRSRSGPS
jgi:hypothetical protein